MRRDSMSTMSTQEGVMLSWNLAGMPWYIFTASTKNVSAPYHGILARYSR